MGEPTEMRDVGRHNNVTTVMDLIMLLSCIERLLNA